MVVVNKKIFNQEINEKFIKKSDSTLLNLKMVNSAAWWCLHVLGEHVEGHTGPVSTHISHVAHK